MRIALAQIDTTAGDVHGNVERIAAAWRRAAEAQADLLVVPELAVVGYPPRDLLLREGVVRAVERATAALAAEHAAGPPAIVGTVARNPDGVGRPLWNVAALLRGGRVEARYAKRLLPTYDVFDERRYFEPGPGPLIVDVAGRRVGLLVCEDVWSTEGGGGRRPYAADPPGELARAGVDLVVAIAASPYHQGKDEQRRRLFAAQARRMACPLVALQQVGGNDDVLFDGRSRVFDAGGRELLRMAAFEEDFACLDLEAAEAPPAADPVIEGAPDEVRQALVMGIRGYVRKTGFEEALVGLSGGVDSAVTACLAVEALGADRVRGLAMPGPYSSEASREDAEALAEACGLALETIPIVQPYEAVLAVLGAATAPEAIGVMQENVQARLRGLLLMARSNERGSLLLTTGNKSEIAVGYCTLYGDMNGGLAVLADVWKTGVYGLAEHYREAGLIPARTIERPPSAELRPDQRDEDSLPPYPLLDAILRQRIEEGRSAGEIEVDGADEGLIDRILRLVERNEYKRRQMAPGLKVSPTAFGVGWRMPLARPMDLRGEA